MWKMITTIISAVLNVLRAYKDMQDKKRAEHRAEVAEAKAENIEEKLTAHEEVATADDPRRTVLDQLDKLRQ